MTLLSEDILVDYTIRTIKVTFCHNLPVDLIGQTNNTSISNFAAEPEKRQELFSEEGLFSVSLHWLRRETRDSVGLWSVAHGGAAQRTRPLGICQDSILMQESGTQEGKGSHPEQVRKGSYSSSKKQYTNCLIHDVGVDWIPVCSTPLLSRAWRRHRRAAS